MEQERLLNDERVADTRVSDKNTNLTKVDVGQHCIIISLQREDALRSVGRSRSSDEVPVMGMERRASVI